ncbi:MAG: glycosyltransferase [Clostridia bacterium]|nr:glycosyltransferase [Clostridia bacterium]
MKVCLANDSFPPQIDGVANAIKNYADVIDKRYGSAIVATPSFAKNEDYKYPYEIVRYPSLRLPKKVGYRAGYPFQPKAMDRLAAFGPDIIHSHCPYVSSYLCRELRAITGAPLVLTYHTKFDIDIKRCLKLKILQTSLITLIVKNIEGSDEVWVVSKGAGENLKELGYAGSYRVMENGVDIPKLPPDENIKASIIEKYGLSPDETVFLSVGRMKWYKNHRLTIDALRKLKDAGYSFKMLFVGSGSDMEAIEKYTVEAGVSDECIFTGPILDREYLRNVYFCADVFVFPSTYDTNGIVVREAAACNLASILVKDSCASEGITDGLNGIIIDENVDSLTAALASICDNRDTARRLGENAANEIYISWEDSVAKAVARYKELIDAKERGLLPQKPRPAFDEQGIKLIAQSYKSYARFKNFEYSRRFRDKDAAGDTLSSVSDASWDGLFDPYDDTVFDTGADSTASGNFDRFVFPEDKDTEQGADRDRSGDTIRGDLS